MNLEQAVKVFGLQKNMYNVTKNPKFRKIKFTSVNSMNYQIKQIEIDFQDKCYYETQGFNENVMGKITFGKFIQLVNNCGIDKKVEK